jgi:hypothetical protein
MKVENQIGYADWCRVDDNGKVKCLTREQEKHVEENRAKLKKTAKIEKDQNRMVPSGLKRFKGWPKKGANFLTSTSKTRSPSWGLAAGASCPILLGPVAQEGVAEVITEIVKKSPELDSGVIDRLAQKIPEKCWSCYGSHGRYPTPEVRRPQKNRQIWFESTPEDQVVATLVYAIKRAGDESCSPKTGTCTFTPGVQPKRFRLFDSGDFTSPRAVRIWYKIARALPGTSFWMPTTAWTPGCGMNKTEHTEMLELLRKANKLPNVVVRPSALRENKASPVLTGLGPGTAIVSLSKDELKENPELVAVKERHDLQLKQVKELGYAKPQKIVLEGKEHYMCPGDCSLCRRCWTKTSRVAYVHHGTKGGSRKSLLTLLRHALGAIPISTTTKRKKDESAADYEARLAKYKITAKRRKAIESAMRDLAITNAKNGPWQAKG